MKKKNIYFLILTFLIINFGLINNVFASQGCNPVFETKTAEYVRGIMTIIRWSGPIIVIILGSFDFAKAMFGGTSSDMKKASKTLTTRLIIAILIFFIPTILNFALTLIDSSTCGI